MEQKSKNLSLKAILISIAVGIWAIVLQNAGVIPTNQNVKVVNTVDTYVNGGNIDADVSGSVSVDNTVDVNIERYLVHQQQLMEHTRINMEKNTML